MISVREKIIMLINDKKINSINWTCPAIDRRSIRPVPDRLTIEALKDPSYVKNQVEEERDRLGRLGFDRYVLPVWQGIEAMALSGRVLAKEGKSGYSGYAAPSDYCVKNLDILRDLDLDFVKDSLIRAVIDTIPAFAGQNLILEMEAPFSILAALMNPMDLYACQAEDGSLLKDILHRIADASALYMKACIEAGCRLFSLADPAGTMDLTGEDYYRRICGESEIYLMKRCRPYLKQSIVHICRKMSLSLFATELAVGEPFISSCAMIVGGEESRGSSENRDNRKNRDGGKESKGTVDESIELLSHMAADAGIEFAGMTCLHAYGHTSDQIVKIKLADEN